MYLARFVPALTWAPAYRASWLRGDAVAGLTIWGLLIPEGIAQPLRDAVRALTAASREPVAALILDLDGSDGLDVTSAEALAAVIAEMRARHVRAGLAHLYQTAAQLLRRAACPAEAASSRTTAAARCSPTSTRPSAGRGLAAAARGQAGGSM